MALEILVEASLDRIFRFQTLAFRKEKRGTRGIRANREKDGYHPTEIMNFV